MTSMPAARLGLRDRGRLADGYVADVVVFDPARVRALATYDEPRQFPEGIEHVLVAGVPVVDGGHPHRRHPGPGAAPGPGLSAPEDPSNRVIPSPARQDRPTSGGTRRPMTTRTLPRPAVAPERSAADALVVAPGTTTRGRARGYPLRREGPAKLTGAAKYTDDLVLPGSLVRGDDPVHGAPGAPPRDRAGSRRRLVDGRRRHRRRHPRREPGQRDQGGPAGPGPGRRRDPPPRRAGGAARRAGSGDDPPPPLPDPPRDRAAAAGLRPRAVRPRLRPVRDRLRRPRGRVRRRGRGRRGRVPRRPPGAALHREQRDDRGPGRGRRDGRPRVPPVPVLRAQGPPEDARPERLAGARRPGRDRRRVRRQGGVPVDHRPPRRAPGPQGRAPGPDDLRAPRGPRRDDEAAPGDHPPPDGRDA